MTSTDVETMFDRAGKRLPGVERGKMLSASGLRDPAAGKFFAFVTRGQLVVKLPAERVTELIASGEGRVFDAGKGRPMKEWVGLTPADEAACVAYMREARKFVAAQADPLIPTAPRRRFSTSRPSHTRR
jgi:hypothetical protein